MADTPEKKDTPEKPSKTEKEGTTPSEEAPRKKAKSGKTSRFGSRKEQAQSPSSTPAPSPGKESDPRRDRPRDDRPRGDRPRDDRPRGDRPQGRRFDRDDRPRGDRPRDDRPRDDRPRGDRPRGDRPRDDRPRGDRPQERRFDRDDRPRGDRRPRDEQTEGPPFEDQEKPPEKGPEALSTENGAQDTSEEKPLKEEFAFEDDESTHWDHWGRLHIAVPKKERWKIAESVGEEGEDPSKRKRGKPKLLRVPANRRADATIPEPEEPRPPEEEITEPPPRAQPLHKTGRSALGKEEEFVKLLLEHPALRVLHPTPSIIGTALARFKEGDQARWLGLNNGLPKILRLDPPLNVAETKQLLEDVADSLEEKELKRVLSVSHRRLTKDPITWWDFIARATLESLLTQGEANLDGLCKTLPVHGPLGIELPPALLLPMLPATATWRIEKLTNPDAADENLFRTIETKIDNLAPPPFRQGVWELAQESGADAPGPDDKKGWVQALLAALHSSLQQPGAAWTRLINRAAEPASYITLGKQFQKSGQPWLSLRALNTALSIQARHTRGHKIRKAALKQMREIPTPVLIHEGRLLVRNMGTEGLWEIQDAPPPPQIKEPREDTSLDELGFPAGLHKILTGASIHTVEALAALDDVALGKIDGLGPKRIEKIRQELASHGLQTKPD